MIPFDDKHQPLLKSCLSIFFASAHRFSRYSHFKMCDIENIGQGHDVQHSQFNKNAKTLTLKMKVKVKKWENETCAIRLELFESIWDHFSEFSYLATNVYAKSGHTDKKQG